MLDLVPIVGPAIGGVLVSLVTLTVSLPVGLATVGFFIVYRLVEDYLLVPKIIGNVVKVPALVTVVAVLLGGTLLGVIGAWSPSPSPRRSSCWPRRCSTPASTRDDAYDAGGSGARRSRWYPDPPPAAARLHLLKHSFATTTIDLCSVGPDAAIRGAATLPSSTS